MNHHSSRGPYHDLVKSMCGGNPSLEYLHEFMGKRQQQYSCRIAVLDFGIRSNNVTKVERRFKPSYHTDLYHFLNGFHSHNPHRRLFIVEDLSADIIEA